MHVVDKRFELAHLTPKGLARLARKYPGEAGLTIAGPIGLGAGAAYTGQRNGRGTKQSNQQGVATMAGGAVGAVGYHGAVLGALHGPDARKRKALAEGYGGKTRSQLGNIERKAWRRAAGGRRKAKPGERTPGQEMRFYRNFPKELPDWKVQRALGWTSRGAIGRGVQATAIAAGGLGGYEAHRAYQRRGVRKSLYQREDRLSVLRTGELAAGLTIGAIGLGRSRMVGAALGRGIKAAQGKNNARVVEALQLAQAAQGSLARGTALPERTLRQIKRVDYAVQMVPASLRPEVAIAAGALLAGHSLPVRRTSYHSVGGW